jgi:hypothetical protein
MGIRAIVTRFTWGGIQTVLFSCIVKRLIMPIFPVLSILKLTCRACCRPIKEIML